MEMDAPDFVKLNLPTLALASQMPYQLVLSRALAEMERLREPRPVMMDQMEVMILGVIQDALLALCLDMRVEEEALVVLINAKCAEMEKCQLSIRNATMEIPKMEMDVQVIAK